MEDDDPTGSLFRVKGRGDSDGLGLESINCCACCDEGRWGRRACNFCGNTIQDSCASLWDCIKTALSKAGWKAWTMFAKAVVLMGVIVVVVLLFVWWATGRNLFIP